MFSFRNVAKLGGIGGAIWGTTIILGAITTAPVTAPVAAAGGAIVGVGTCLGLFGGRK